MKTVIITSIIFFFCVNNLLIFAQSVTTEISEAKNEYQNGLKHGKWFEYLDDIGLQVEEEDKSEYFRVCNYTQGKLIGLSKLYAKKDSSLISEIVFKNDETDGFYRTYFSSGNLKEEMCFESGKRSGTHQKYNDKGILILESVYENDMLNGASTIYSDNGQLEYKAHYKDNKMHGLEQIYYENGQLHLESYYENGELLEVTVEYHEDGSMKDPNRIERFYWDNGQLESERPYVNGQLNGDVKNYYENGRLEMVSTYTNGKLNGTAKEYHENGCLFSETPYVNGHIHGIVKVYYKDGKNKSVSQTEYVMGQELRSPFSVEDKTLLLKRLKGDTIVNYDISEELFLARNKKTGKWGMYREYSVSPTEIVPAKYDSINTFKDDFVIVWNNGKVGVGLQAWSSKTDKYIQKIPCIYDEGKIIINHYFIAKKGDKWGAINWQNGKEIEFPIRFS